MIEYLNYQIIMISLSIGVPAILVVGFYKLLAGEQDGTGVSQE